jgi:DNA-directed RNA polymerase specialized sigma24 family protein
MLAAIQSECMADTRNDAGVEKDAWFTTTHWSVMLAARQSDLPLAHEALERLCQTYWFPLYAYIRRQGETDDAAKDLTQGFFARFLEKNYLGQVHREKGKFRSFLLGSLKHFLSDEWDKNRAQKRGGGQALVPLDASSADERYRLEPVDAMDAEKLFERRWVLALLEQARLKLEAEYAAAGKARLYACLSDCDSADAEAPTYAALAAELKMSESAVKSALHRMRQRYRELVRLEVANTVQSPAEIDEELRYLITVIGQ